MSLSESSSTSAAPRRKAWQFSLWTLMLIAAAIGAWTAYFKTLQEEASLLERLPLLREIARELHIKDPQQFAIVQQQELFQGDTRWRVYLPPGNSYRIAWTTEIEGRHFSPNRFPKPTSSTQLKPGEHDLELLVDLDPDSDRWKIQALANHKLILEESQPREWNPMAGGVIFGGPIRKSEQSTTNLPLWLYVRIFQGADPKDGRAVDSAPGLILWIEKVKP